jgi:hypothetical protein
LQLFFKNARQRSLDVAAAGGVLDKEGGEEEPEEEGEDKIASIVFLLAVIRYADRGAFSAALQESS